MKQVKAGFVPIIPIIPQIPCQLGFRKVPKKDVSARKARNISELEVVTHEE